MLIPQVPFFGLDSKQIDLKWVEQGYGLEANIFDGESLHDKSYTTKFSDVLSFVQTLNPSLLTLHFPTDNADYLNSEFIKKQLYEFINLAIKYNAAGITVHANQFMNIAEFQTYNLIDNRKRIIEFFKMIDEEIKGTNIWIGVENLPIIGNLGDDFDPIFVYPEDFNDLVNLDLSNVGITWDICHWSITYLTRLGISKLLRQEEIEYKDFHKYINLMNHIKHLHFSSFKHLTIPYSEVRGVEGESPTNGSINEHLLHKTLLKVKNQVSSRNIGIVFEVQETDYTNRVKSWETLNWFQKNITGIQANSNFLKI
ncbi:endonuclease [Bacillus mycoides]|uniref:endonuclease n=1 Tax=Bacillus mycoides TaxID=1405 RepID=UPI002E07A3FF|nr:endonuclease [Bacillus mycoides]